MKSKTMSRKEVAIREHKDLSTSDLNQRVMHLRRRQEQLTESVATRRSELKLAEAELRDIREAADAVQGLIDAR